MKLTRTNIADAVGNMNHKISTRKDTQITLISCYNDEGKLQRVIPVRKKLIHGMMLDFHSDGAIKTFTPYIRGRKHGVQVTQTNKYHKLQRRKQ